MGPAASYLACLKGRERADAFCYGPVLFCVVPAFAECAVLFQAKIFREKAESATDPGALARPLLEAVIVIDFKRVRWFGLQ